MAASGVASGAGEGARGGDGAGIGSSNVAGVGPSDDDGFGGGMVAVEGDSRLIWVAAGSGTGVAAGIGYGSRAASSPHELMTSAAISAVATMRCGRRSKLDSLLSQTTHV